MNILEHLENHKSQIVAEEGMREYLCLEALVDEGIITSFEELAEYGVPEPSGSTHGNP